MSVRRQHYVMKRQIVQTFLGHMCAPVCTVSQARDYLENAQARIAYCVHVCMNLEHVYNHSAIKPELVIVGHGSNDIISLTVEPGRPLNVVCESHRVHVGDVGWTNLGEKEVCLVTCVHYISTPEDGSEVPREEVTAGVPYVYTTISLSEGLGFSRASLTVGFSGIAHPVVGRYQYTCTATNTNVNSLTTSISVNIDIPGYYNICFTYELSESLYLLHSSHRSKYINIHSIFDQRRFEQL